MRALRLRKLIDGQGNKVSFLIRRLRCIKCGRYHHELPDCMVPYKRHCAETIEKIIARDGREAGDICTNNDKKTLDAIGTPTEPDNVPCDDKTIRRIRLWWRTVLPYFLNVLKSLSIKYEIPYNPVPAFKKIVRAIVNSGSWIFASSLCTRSASSVP